MATSPFCAHVERWQALMRELAVSMVKASFRSKIVNLNPALAPFRGAQEWAATQLSLWGTICWEDARRA